MNHRLPFVVPAAITVLMVPGRDAAIAIFEFGGWVGAIAAAIVLGSIAWTVSGSKR